MVKTALVEKDIEEGKRLIEELDKTKFKVRAALWFYMAESDEWRLYIVSPFVEKEGPKKAYTFIQSVLASISQPAGITLQEISVLSPSNDLIKIIRSTIKTGQDISGIRVTKNVFNNTLVEDAYIYRML
ncbi:MAG: hypothetical protein HZA16_08120 [Nitrospirae bacterium]|nr:hypothetical protein [Nitrospirota bacterium]